MRQSAIKKYHKDASSPDPFNNPVNTTTPPWQGYEAQGMAGLLTSSNLGSEQIVQIVQHWQKALGGNEALFSRASTHLIVILLAALAIGLSNAPFLWGGIRAIRPLRQAPVEPIAPTIVVEEGAPLTLPTQLNNAEDDVLTRAAVPKTIIPDRTREEISTYVVQSGDTIYGIAAKFGIAPETIMWSNTVLEDNPDLLRVGQELIVLPVNGVYHQVGAGDTIDGIAATFKTEPVAIINYPLNELDPDEPIIEPGQWLVVPGGTKPFVPRTVTAYSGPIPEDATSGSGVFAWPTSGSIYQGYWSAHPGLDIAAWFGAPVNAADSGYVVLAGWDDTGYGYHVVIDHGNGFQTLYGHLQAYYVDAGDNVAKGQQIGEMGNTGNSTGPHLHFEVRQGTVQRNPAGFLP